MKLDVALLLLYVLAPFAVTLIPWPKSFQRGLFTPGSLMSIFRVLFLFFLSRTIVSEGGVVTLSGTLVNGYPLEIVLSLNSYRYGFLLTAELCFLLAHWMCSFSSRHGTLIKTLINLVQGFCALFIMSDNAVATGALLALAGVVFFYLIRFSIEGPQADLGAAISKRMYSLCFLLGLLVIGWGITEFGGKNLLFSKVEASKLGITTWLLLLIFALPIPPWSKWFSQAVEFLPEGVTLALVTFLSAVALKFAALFSIVYPDIGWKQKLLLYVIGIIGSVFSISGLFSARSRRKALSNLPGFFYSLLLISVGVSKSTLIMSGYFIGLFLPVFTGLLLYATVLKPTNSLQKGFVGLLLAIILGLPGTPIFLIFSSIGARSLDMGMSYALVFMLLWFFYLSVNVYICRRIFMDKSPPHPEATSRLVEEAPISFAGYGIFLICFIVATTHLAWRIL